MTDTSASGEARTKADAVFDEHRQTVWRQTDRMFAYLMCFQWVAGIVAACVVSPRTWSGAASGVHPHVFAAVVLGGLTNLFPAALAVWRPGLLSTRIVVSIGQALTSALLIHLTGGRIETHFHVFGSLAFLAFYRDWRVLVPATVVTAADHFLRGMLFPQSVYGVGWVSAWRWLEHAGWVVFEDVVLVASCVRGTREMRRIAERTAETMRRTAELAATRDTALDCIVGMDHNGFVTEFNPAAERTFGYARAEVVGRSLADVMVPPRLRAAHTAGLARFLATGDARVVGRRIELPAVRSDGSEFPAEVAITAVRVDGAPCFVAYLRDITERKRAEEQARHAEKLAMVAARTDNAVIITDVDGLIEWVNDGFTRITGYELAEVVGKKPGSFLQGPETDRETVAYIRGQLAKREGFRAEILNYAKDGRTYWLAVEVQPVRDADGTLHFMAIESDVTERREAERALRRAKEDAERAREAAVSANLAKSQFLANMSHEIRTPLNGVIGMADLLVRRGELSERQLRYARVIKSSADSLLGLINDVLDFSKIEAGKLDLSCVDFDLRETLEEVAEMLAPRAAAKGLEFACHVQADVPDRLHGDPDRLRQVIVNLASNAIKFTERGEVVIRVAQEEGAGGGDVAAAVALRFGVCDTGVGIPPDRLDRLFKSFSQVDASNTRKYGGTGLGLAIVKQLSELMGGTVGVESVVGSGSTFWFTARLPVGTSPRSGPAAVAAASESLRGMRAMVVDDHAACRDVLRDQLAGWGFDVTLAASGADALRLMAEAADAGRPFGLALVDLLMPRMDGIALGRAVRADARLSGARMLMLTCMDRPFDSEMREAGFVSCLTKPVRHSQLFDAVMDAIAGPGARREPVADEAEAGAPVRGSLRSTRVLLAEDNEINQEVARELLAEAGCEVQVVANGEQAVRAVGSAEFDVVLMDCQMPVMDGWEAARQIRKLESGGGPRTPIVALTASAVEGDRQRCLEAGMDDYVTKPIDPEMLLEAIRRFRRLDGAADAGAGKSGAVAEPSPAAAVSGGVAPAGDAVDVESLLRRCQGKASLAERLLMKFESQLPGQLAELRELLGAGDRTALGRLAHTIKGTAANLSVERLRSAAASLEAAAGADAPAGLDEQLRQVCRVAEECLGGLPGAVERLRTAGLAPAAV